MHALSSLVFCPDHRHCEAQQQQQQQQRPSYIFRVINTLFFTRRVLIGDILAVICICHHFLFAKIIKASTFWQQSIEPLLEYEMVQLLRLPVLLPVWTYFLTSREFLLLKNMRSTWISMHRGHVFNDPS